MHGFLQHYLSLLIFGVVASVVSVALALLPRFFASSKIEEEKVMAYECGFEPKSLPKHRFGVRFYLIAMLFVIFDLEVAFIFPWAVSLTKIGYDGFWSMVVFLAVLTVGFLYEWGKGALEWE